MYALLPGHISNIYKFHEIAALKKKPENLLLNSLYSKLNDL